MERKHEEKKLNRKRLERSSTSMREITLEMEARREAT
jgi:hypothetical protein